ncbi:MAG: hypothetical protein KatS3mg050_2111 [Litorilinea sp.]|nr:MAG: hypothetical protein KatS3mg050_2111 [Litorilinea sp.]
MTGAASSTRLRRPVVDVIARAVISHYNEDLLARPQTATGDNCNR